MKRFRTVAAMVVCLCAVHPIGGFAQSVRAPAEEVERWFGHEVRVATAGGATTGILRDLSASEVVIERHRQPVRLPIEEVLAVRSSYHYRRNFAIAGLGLGFIMGSTGSVVCSGECEQMFDALVTAGLGSIFGYLVGKWVEPAPTTLYQTGPAPTVSLRPFVGVSKRPLDVIHGGQQPIGQVGIRATVGW